MIMQYVFTIHTPELELRSIVVRKRIDFAKLAAEKLLRELLHNLALLDRQISNDAILWVRDWNSCDPKGSFKVQGYILNTSVNYEPGTNRA
jgi:hypothetical protein